MRSLIIGLFLSILVSSGVSSAEEERIPIAGGRAAPGTVGDIYWNCFAEDIIKGSNGRLSVRLLIRGEAGPEETLFMALRRGKIQVAGISTSGISLILPELDVLRAPFLFDSIEEVGFVLDSYLRKPVAALLFEKDLIMLDWMSAGWLNLYSKTPIVRPEHLLGKRMRINVDDSARMFMQAVGADFAQISFSDVLPSLQTGLIDGGEQSTQLFITGGFFEYAPHYTLTRHAFLTAVVVANRQWFENIPEEDQAVFRHAVPSDSWYRDFFTKGNAKALEETKARGLSVQRLTPRDRKIWKGHTMDLRKRLIDRAGGRAQELYDIILEAKTAFAAQHPSRSVLN